MPSERTYDVGPGFVMARVKPCGHTRCNCQPHPACACPKTDARYCLEWRTKDDLRVMTGGDSELGDDEVCECACHADDEDMGDAL